MAKNVIRSLTKARRDEKKRPETLAQIRNMMELAKTEPGVPVLSEELDTDPMLLNVLNGTLDLATGNLRPHRREDLITRVAPVVYDTNAKCPTFERFLDEIMGGNASLSGFLRRAVGYALTGLTSEQCMFVFHGTGSNGKSTFLDAVMAILGEGYALQTPTETIVSKVNGFDAIPNDVARLKGARFVAANEIEEGRRLNEALVKQLTGDERVTARFMRGEWFEFRPEFKLFLAVNHLPEIRGTDHGIWRRIRAVPFTKTIPDEKQDKDLSAKLHAEASGILNWALEGLREWLSGGLNAPPEVLAATTSYRELMDSLGDFLKHCCVQLPNVRAQSGDLYAEFVKWSDTDKPLTHKAFSQRLKGKRPVTTVFL